MIEHLPRFSLENQLALGFHPLFPRDAVLRCCAIDLTIWIQHCRSLTTLAQTAQEPAPMLA